MLILKILNRIKVFFIKKHKKLIIKKQLLNFIKENKRYNYKISSNILNIITNDLYKYSNAISIWNKNKLQKKENEIEYVIKNDLFRIFKNYNKQKNDDLDDKINRLTDKINKELKLRKNNNFIVNLLKNKLCLKK